MEVSAKTHSELYEYISGFAKEGLNCDGCGEHIRIWEFAYASVLLPDNTHEKYRFQKPEAWAHNYLQLKPAGEEVNRPKVTMRDTIIVTRLVLSAIELTLEPRKDSRELSTAFTHLQEGSMWLGKVLGALGTTAYPESSNPESKVIEKRADTVTEPHPIPVGRIEGVKAIRQSLKDQIEGLKVTAMELTEDILHLEDDVDEGSVITYLFYSVKSLELAVMWLGMELNRIRINLDRMEQFKIEREEQVATNITNAAKVSYDTYGKVTDFKNFQGNPMPKFDELPETIQNAWKEVGKLGFGLPEYKGMSAGNYQNDIWEDAQAPGSGA